MRVLELWFRGLGVESLVVYESIFDLGERESLFRLPSQSQNALSGMISPLVCCCELTGIAS
jgi:hypothetical protein